MLPIINNNIKPYLLTFMKKYEGKTKPYSVALMSKNKIRVRVFPIEDAEFKKLHILMFFDSQDKVRTAIDTDDQSFYTGMFYIEVLRKRRDNEAWQIIRNRYPKDLWVEKYIYFLLNAPTHIIDIFNNDDGK